MDAGETQFLKCLLCQPRGLSLIPRTHTDMPSVVACVPKPTTAEEETVDSWSSLESQPGLLVSSKSVGDPVSKQ